MALKDFFSDAFSAGVERIEGIAEAGAAGLLSGIRGDTSQPQVETGDSGKGGTVVQPTPTGFEKPATVQSGPLAGLPSWAVPVGAGLAAVLVLSVVVAVVRK